MNPINNTSQTQPVSQVSTILKSTSDYQQSMLKALKAMTEALESVRKTINKNLKL